MTRCEGCRLVLSLLSKQVDAQLALEAIEHFVKADNRVDAQGVRLELKLNCRHSKYFEIAFSFDKVLDSADNCGRQAVRGTVRQIVYPDSYGLIWFLQFGSGVSVGYSWGARLLHAIVNGHGRRRELSSDFQGSKTLIKGESARELLVEALICSSEIEQGSLRTRFVGSVKTDYAWALELSFVRACGVAVVAVVVSMFQSLHLGTNPWQAYVVSLRSGEDGFTSSSQSLNSNISVVAKWIEKGIPQALDTERFMDFYDFTTCWVGQGCRLGYQGPPKRQIMYFRYFADVQDSAGKQEVSGSQEG